MKALLNTPITKEELMKGLLWHQKQDAFLKGTFNNRNSKSFKGCAVGCTLNTISQHLSLDISKEEHYLYEKYLNIPEWVARLQDTLFEGMGGTRSKTFPVEFGEAINIGAELDQIKALFIIFVLESTLVNVESEKFKEHREAVQTSINLWKRHDANATSTGFAVRFAARSAVWFASGFVARSAVWSVAGVAARSAAFEKYADKLLELMKECKAAKETT